MLLVIELDGRVEGVCVEVIMGLGYIERFWNSVGLGNNKVRFVDFVGFGFNLGFVWYVD